MNKKLIFLMVLLWPALALSLVVVEESARKNPVGKIIVVMDGFENDGGMAKVGLFSSAERWADDSALPDRGGLTEVKNQQAKFIFEKVPYGEYAIKVFHDENANGKLDKGVFGKPKESYGFSNNPSSRDGVPDFDRAKFTFDDPEMTISITVR